ncbi:MAG: isopentenyl-diphosphate Delta-isomerase, partial [Chitinophagaceae bacterium]
MHDLILVNEQDEPIGTMEKMEAHRQGLLHRAFSVFLFDDEGNMLLQQRADEKYHSPGLWTNACCSHPMPGEDTLKAA